MKYEPLAPLRNRLSFGPRYVLSMVLWVLAFILVGWLLMQHAPVTSAFAVMLAFIAGRISH